MVSLISVLFAVDILRLVDAELLGVLSRKSASV